MTAKETGTLDTSASRGGGTAPSARWRDAETVVQTLKDAARRFTLERDWERFHTPKDLAMALAIEAGELLQLYLWVDDRIPGARPAPRRADVEAEVADVAICLLHFCNTNNIDLARAIRRKLTAIEAKYPVQKVKGSALKYSEYEDTSARPR